MCMCSMHMHNYTSLMLNKGKFNVSVGAITCISQQKIKMKEKCLFEETWLMQMSFKKYLVN